MNSTAKPNGYSLCDRQRLEAVVAEQKRRAREERLRKFEPMTEPYNDQLAFFHSRADIRFLFGGNRSGKTE
jgi:hypothetical protein